MAGQYLFEHAQWKDFFRGLVESELGAQIVTTYGSGGVLVYVAGESFNITEFPGNCSTFVVSSIQGKSFNLFEMSRKISELLASKIGYAMVMMSLAGYDVQQHRQYLLENGYTLFTEPLVNYHSGNENFFFLKRIEMTE